MRNFVMMTILALGATVATAQTAIGNAAGTSLVPATGAASVAAPVAAAPTGAPANTAAELAKIKYQTAIVCRSSVETGSLIAKKKTCLTRKQWAYVSDENERTARQFVADNTTKQGGPN
jgi:hypothetical protein